MPKTTKRASQPSHPEDDSQDQIQKALLPAHSINSVLFKISTEVRLMIFQYLIPRDKFINIRSGPENKRTYTSRTFSTLRLINQQIYLEANELFYTHNFFVIGNGSFGRSGCTNLHALKRVLACVPANHLSKIRKLKLQLSLLTFDGYLPQKSYEPLGHADDLKTLARAIMRRFTGVTSLELCIPKWGEVRNSHFFTWNMNIHGTKFRLLENGHFFHHNWVRLIEQETWPAFIKLLLEHQKLEDIYTGAECEELRQSLLHLVGNSNATGRITILHKGLEDGL